MQSRKRQRPVADAPGSETMSGVLDGGVLDRERESLETGLIDSRAHDLL